jgi:hypothetical protein
MDGNSLDNSLGEKKEAMLTLIEIDSLELQIVIT